MLAFNSLVFRSLATIALLIAIVAALFFAKAVFLPITLGILVALILHLPIMALHRAGLPKFVAIIALLSLVSAFSTAIFFLTAGPITSAFNSYPEIVTELRVKMFNLRETFAAAQQAGDAISKVAEDVSDMVSDSEVQEVVVKEPNFLARAATSVADIATGVIVTLTISGFILAMRRPFLTLATLPYSTTGAKLNAARIWKGAEGEVSHYFLVTSIINIGLGAAVGLALWALGVPMPHVWGIAVALLNYILFVGPAIGTAGLLVASIIQFDAPLDILAPPAAYLFINFIEANMVTPHFLGRRLNIAPMAILLSLLFWGWLWGFPGLIVGLPILIVVKAISDRAAPLDPVRRMLTPRRAPRSIMEPHATLRVGIRERRHST